MFVSNAADVDSCASWHALIELDKPEDDETDRKLTFAQKDLDEVEPPRAGRLLSA